MPQRHRDTEFQLMYWGNYKYARFSFKSLIKSKRKQIIHTFINRIVNKLCVSVPLWQKSSVMEYDYV